MSVFQDHPCRVFGCVTTPTIERLFELRLGETQLWATVFLCGYHLDAVRQGQVVEGVPK